MTGMEPLLMLQIGSAALGAVSAISSASAASGAAEHNAAMNRQRAKQTIEQAEEREKRFRRQSAKRQGAMRAAGANLDLLEDSAVEEELEALSIRHGGTVEAAGFTSSGKLDSMRARSARITGAFGAGSSILIGAEKIYDK
jgi:hypothetical protein